MIIVLVDENIAEVRSFLVGGKIVVACEYKCT